MAVNGQWITNQDLSIHTLLEPSLDEHRDVAATGLSLFSMQHLYRLIQ